jgi:hypothetical protein
MTEPDSVGTDKTTWATGFLRRALREPLLHFLGIGLALFLAYSVVRGPGEGPAGDAIMISQGRVNQIAESFLLLSGRMPSRGELETLVDDFVSEEVAYREAVAMGLDADDTIVRRRMRQKLEFLIEDDAASEAPTEADLRQWLQANTDLYRVPERRAIRQVMSSADRRGQSASDDAKAFLVQLNARADPAGLGDSSMLPAAMPLTTQAGVSSLFGDDFAAAVFAHRGEGWFGPVASAFGQHVVLVMEIAPGRAAALADIRDKVRADWIEARRDAGRDAFHARMRNRYDIRIEWPEPWSGLPETANPEPKTKRTPEVGE